MLYYIITMGDYTIKKYNLLKNSYIKSKFLGIIFIIIGVVFLLDPTNLKIKIGFIFIFLGLLMTFIITEKTIPKKISDTLVEENIDTINKLINELDLQGNAIFFPKSDNLNEERIFIPPNKTGTIKIPEIKDNNVIHTTEDGKILGISVSPSGLKLIDEIQKDKAFKNITIENLEEKLQLFVGINLLKSISFKKQKNGWDLEIENFTNNNKNQYPYNQYPGPTSSAAITMITRILNKKIRIYNTTYSNKKIKYHLNLIKKRVNIGEKNK